MLHCSNPAAPEGSNMVPMLFEELCTNHKPRFFFSMLVIGASIKLYYVAHITSPLQHCEIVCSYAGLWVKPRFIEIKDKLLEEIFCYFQH